MEPMQFNDIEIRVHGLQRSGNHAIMNWIAAQSTGACIVLNDCKPGTNPFESMQEYCLYSDGDLISLEYTWDDSARQRASSSAPSQRNVLIHSYEDRELSGDRVSESWVGRSNSYFDILIVRDPLNLFASRLGLWNELTGRKERRLVVELWKKYAREALGLTSFLDPRYKVVGEFARWKEDKEYRRGLSSKLGLDFSDRGIDSMIKIGPGSSFDSFKHLTQASNMAVNERWKSVTWDSDFRSILSDNELQDLSIRLFGLQASWTAVREDF
jgi:hypothetical protein